MSTIVFDNLLKAEVDRLDDLFIGQPSRQHLYVDDPTLELPGMAVIASRTSALRRELLARIAVRKTPWLNSNNPDQSILLIPNHSPKLFVRQMLASICKIDFEDLDTATISDDSWDLLTTGVKLLKFGSDSEDFVDEPRFEITTTAPSVVELLELVRGAKSGTTIILENYHVLRGISDNSSSLAELRNAAAHVGAYLYIGCGLSHWHEVRDKGGIFLSDLAESLNDAPHVADLITILTPKSSGASATVFDTRYSRPWEGDLSTLTEK